MVIFYYVKRTDKVTLYLKEKVYLSPTKNAMCMVYNGSDHFDFLKVDRETDNNDNMTEEQFAAKNTLGKAVRVSQQYKLSCEIQKKKRKLLGLGTNPPDNMSKAETDIVKHVKKLREKIDDHSDECLGIVQMNNWHGGVKIWLWGMNTLVILS